MARMTGAVTSSRLPAPDLSAAPFCESARRLMEAQGIRASELAQRSGFEVARVRELLSGERAPSPVALDRVAGVLGVSPGYFREHRLERVLAFLERDPDRVNELFLRSLSDAERSVVDVSSFDNRPLRDVLRMLLADEEITQGELAESLGLAPSDFSLIVNRRSDMPPDFVSSIAHALGAEPELFLAHRLDVVAAFLEASPSTADDLWDELSRTVELDAYEEWPMRTLPDPRSLSLVEIAKSLIEIVSVEGPVVGARAYEVRLRASDLQAETRELRGLLNRASYAATRSGALLSANEQNEQTQKFLVLRLPGTPEVRTRQRGPRAVPQIPLSEVAAVVASTEAYRFGHSLEAVQNEMLATYHVDNPRLVDLEHINRAVNLKGDR